LILRHILGKRIPTPGLDPPDQILCDPPPWKQTGPITRLRGAWLATQIKVTNTGLIVSKFFNIRVMTGVIFNKQLCAPMSALRSWRAYWKQCVPVRAPSSQRLKARRPNVGERPQCDANDALAPAAARGYRSSAWTN